MKEGALGEEVARNILHIDGDDHRRLRNLVNPAFTPRAADRWRPLMREFISGLFAEVEGDARVRRGRRADQAPYPAMTIATVVGAPTADAERLADWSRWIQLQFDGPDPGRASRGGRARLRGAVRLPRRPGRREAGEPGDDLFSTLIAARDGEDRLDDAELRNLVLNVLVGGVDTTQSQLAHALRLFADHPEQWELLGREPERAPNAVSEVIRVAPVTPFTARIVVEEIELPRRRLPRGDDHLHLRTRGQSRPEPAAGRLRHHPRGRRQAGAHLRRRRPLLPRRQPRPRRARRGPRVPGTARTGARADGRARVRLGARRLRAHRAADPLDAMSSDRGRGLNCVTETGRPDEPSTAARVA